METSFSTPRQLQETLGAGIRALRLRKNFTQGELARKAAVAPRSLTSLENGQGSSVGTLVRVLKALDAAEVIAQLAPQPTISPLALLKNPAPPRRARKPRRASTP